METVPVNTMEAAVSNEQEELHSMDVAEAKEPEIVWEKKASKKSQEIKERKNYAQGEFVAKESYPAAGCARVSTNKNAQLVCSRNK